MSKRLPPIHPGEHLQDFLDDYNLTMHKLAKALHVPPNRINAIVRGQRGITGETALRLARYFGTTPQMWLNMQAHYEFEVARDKFDAVIRKEVKPLVDSAAA